MSCRLSCRLSCSCPVVVPKPGSPGAQEAGLPCRLPRRQAWGLPWGLPCRVSCSCPVVVPKPGSPSAQEADLPCRPPRRQAWGLPWRLPWRLPTLAGAGPGGCKYRCLGSQKKHHRAGAASFESTQTRTSDRIRASQEECVIS